MGDGQSYPAMASDSKSYRHKIERFGGKMALIADESSVTASNGADYRALACRADCPVVRGGGRYLLPRCPDVYQGGDCEHRRANIKIERVGGRAVTAC